MIEYDMNTTVIFAFCQLKLLQDSSHYKSGVFDLREKINYHLYYYNSAVGCVLKEDMPLDATNIKNFKNRAFIHRYISFIFR